MNIIQQYLLTREIKNYTSKDNEGNVPFETSSNSQEIVHYLKKLSVIITSKKIISPFNGKDYYTLQIGANATLRNAPAELFNEGILAKKVFYTLLNNRKYNDLSY